jgi:hypothetical protein
MKSFKISNSLILVVVCFIFLVSCNKFSTENLPRTTAGSSDSQPDEPGKKAIKYLPIPDYQRNMAMAMIPVPTNWNFNKTNDPIIFLEAPDGIKVSYVQGDQFMYSNNPYIAQQFQQMGGTVKPFEPIEKVVQTFEQLLSKDGYKLLKQYHLPQFERTAYSLDKQFFKGYPEKNSFKVVGTEWEDKNGLKILILIQHYLAESQESYYWGYDVESVEAPPEFFERAKQDFLNAKLNVRMNSQWITAVNNENRQKSQQITNNHIDRMNVLRAQGQQIIANGRQHDAMTTRNHQKFMDNLNDRITVTSPSFGQSYDVALGSDHYWINDQNQLITSDNANYNPNQSNYSSGNWEEAQINY